MATPTSYQRVNTATDYDTTAHSTYLKFDGVDDSLATNSIDFTATDKMTVWSGVRKLSSVEGTVVELSDNSLSVNGTFGLFAPNTTGDPYGFSSRGTTRQLASNAPYVPPITNIVTGLADISGDATVLRVNSTAVSTNTGDQGAGNYGNYPLYIGSRAGTSLRLNGRMYSLIVRGAESTATEITDTEDWVNNVTKAY